ASSEEKTRWMKKGLKGVGRYMRRGRRGWSASVKLLDSSESLIVALPGLISPAQMRPSEDQFFSDPL
ncbi:hypothetical protein K0M31_014035, partial [Melipona bicolor]